MKKFVCSTALVMMVSLAALGVPPGLVMVQFRAKDHTVTVTRGAKQTKTYDAKSTGNVDNELANVEQLHALFTGLYGEGYALQNSTVAGSESDNSQTVTYLFVKP